MKKKTTPAGAKPVSTKKPAASRAFSARVKAVRTAHEVLARL